eukprot:scaffold5724_cov97-Skeletonema_dohrnii-CCMP3373.AAC.1
MSACLSIDSPPDTELQEREVADELPFRYSIMPLFRSIAKTSATMTANGDLYIASLQKASVLLFLNHLRAMRGVTNFGFGDINVELSISGMSIDILE